MSDAHWITDDDSDVPSLCDSSEESTSNDESNNQKTKDYIITDDNLPDLCSDTDSEEEVNNKLPNTNKSSNVKQSDRPKAQIPKSRLPVPSTSATRSPTKVATPSKNSSLTDPVEENVPLQPVKSSNRKKKKKGRKNSVSNESELECTADNKPPQALASKYAPFEPKRIRDFDPFSGPEFSHRTWPRYERIRELLLSESYKKGQPKTNSQKNLLKTINVLDLLTAVALDDLSLIHCEYFDQYRRPGYIDMAMCIAVFTMSHKTLKYLAESAGNQQFSKVPTYITFSPLHIVLSKPNHEALHILMALKAIHPLVTSNWNVKIGDCPNLGTLYKFLNDNLKLDMERSNLDCFYHRVLTSDYFDMALMTDLHGQLEEIMGLPAAFAYCKKNFGVTPLDVACLSNNTEMAQFMLKSVQEGAIDVNYNALLSHLVEVGNFELAKAFITGFSIPYDVFAERKTTKWLSFLDICRDLNLIDPVGLAKCAIAKGNRLLVERTLPMLPADVTLGPTGLTEFAYQGDNELLRRCLEKGATVLDAEVSPIFGAIKGHRPDTVMLLLEARIPVDLVIPESQESIFHVACREGDPIVLKALIDWCVERNMGSLLVQVDGRNRTPLHAIKNREIRKLMNDGVAAIKKRKMDESRRAKKTAHEVHPEVDEAAILQAAMANAVKREGGTHAGGKGNQTKEAKKETFVTLKMKLDRISKRIEQWEESKGDIVEIDVLRKLDRMTVATDKSSNRSGDDAFSTQKDLPEYNQAEMERIVQRRQQLLPIVDSDDNQDDEELDEGQKDEEDEVAAIINPTSKPDEIDVDKDEMMMTTDYFSSCSWEIVLTRTAITQWQRLDKVMWIRVLRRLSRLSKGQWSKTLAKRLSGASIPPSLKLFETKFSKGGRIVWEIAVDFSQRLSSVMGEQDKFVYSEVVRVWNMSLDHDNVLDCIGKIVDCHNKSLRANMYRELRLETTNQVRTDTAGQKLFLPKVYSRDNTICTDRTAAGMTFFKIHEVLENEQEREGDENDRERIENGRLQAVEMDREKHQKAVHRYMVSDDAYTLEKFYGLSTVMVQRLHEHCKQHPEQHGDHADRLIGEERNEEDHGFDYPFRPSEVEHKIISLNPNPPCSILLLGRSGTGKTTCALFRMWHVYYNYWSTVRLSSPLYQGPFPELQPHLCHLHQVFITANPVLRTEVQRTFRSFLYSSNLRRLEHKKYTPTTLRDVPEECFPLFLTSREWIMVLDATTPKPFFPRDSQGKPIVRIVAKGFSDENAGRMEAIPEIDFEEGEWDFDEPNRPGKGGDEGGDMKVADQDASPHAQTFVEIDFNYFASVIWPVLNSNGKWDFDPSMVFTEIFSFIKGSIEALENSTGYLTLEEYETMGRKKSASFHHLRSTVYEIFLEYERYKKSKRHVHRLYDLMDLVHHIYEQLAEHGYCGTPIHTFTHDEVQDFTQAELRLNFLCCSDPNAMLFTGDTCQTIAKGIGFRFQDLASVFYAEREKGKTRNHALMTGSRQLMIPKIQSLTQNFRAHSGILNMAASVVELLEEFFPWSLDILEKDTGVFNGPQPLLFDSKSFEDLAVLLYGGRPKETTIDFGAHQVILVRNQQSKRDLPPEFRQALVMTIFESKGLEFDDVLLFNFFKDSKASKEWRTVTAFQDRVESQTSNGTKVEQKGGSSFAVSPRPLEFNAAKHSILMSEFKHLYTAITRARVNLWMYDESVQNRLPIFDYFRRKRLAIVIDKSQLTEDAQNKSYIKAFPKKSSKKEWHAKGSQLLKMNLYGPAARCFSISGDKELEQCANAFFLANGAKNLQGDSRISQYVDAADVFSMLAQYDKAARCLYTATKYKLAARIFVCLKQYAHAAEAFSKASDAIAASENFARCGKMAQALAILTKHRMWKSCIEFVEAHRLENILRTGRKRGDLLTTDEYAEKAALHEYEYGNRSEALSLVEIIKDLSVQERVLRRWQSWDDVVSVLMMQGKYENALYLASIHWPPNKVTDFAIESGNSKMAMTAWSMELDGMVRADMRVGTPKENVQDSERQIALRQIMRRIAEEIPEKNNLKIKLLFYEGFVTENLDLLDICRRRFAEDGNDYAYNICVTRILDLSTRSGTTEANVLKLKLEFFATMLLRWRLLFEKIENSLSGTTRRFIDTTGKLNAWFEVSCSEKKVGYSFTSPLHTLIQEANSNERPHPQPFPQPDKEGTFAIETEEYMNMMASEILLQLGRCLEQAVLVLTDVGSLFPPKDLVGLETAQEIKEDGRGQSDISESDPEISPFPWIKKSLDVVIQGIAASLAKKDARIEQYFSLTDMFEASAAQLLEFANSLALLCYEKLCQMHPDSTVHANGRIKAISETAQARSSNNDSEFSAGKEQDSTSYRKTIPKDELELINSLPSGVQQCLQRAEFAVQLVRESRSPHKTHDWPPQSDTVEELLKQTTNSREAPLQQPGEEDSFAAKQLLNYYEKLWTEQTPKAANSEEGSIERLRVGSELQGAEGLDETASGDEGMQWSSIEPKKGKVGKWVKKRTRRQRERE